MSDSVKFHVTCVNIIFNSVWVAEWPFFSEIAAHSVDHMFSLYFDILILVIAHFGLEGWIWLLIASVPGLCMFFYFHNLY